jgi:hypothetical protein
LIDRGGSLRGDGRVAEQIAQDVATDAHPGGRRTDRGDRGDRLGKDRRVAERAGARRLVGEVVGNVDAREALFLGLAGSLDEAVARHSS